MSFQLIVKHFSLTIDQSQDVSTNGTASDQSRTRGQLPDGYMDMGEAHYLKPTPRHISGNLVLFLYYI